MEDALCGRAGIDTREVIGELVEDLLDSVRLALEASGADQIADKVVETVRDYYANHYCD